MGNTERVLRARIQAIDNFTQPMRRIISQTKAFQAVAKAVKPIVLKAKDMASKIINKVKAQIDKFKNTKFGLSVSKNTLLPVAGGVLALSISVSK